MVAINTTPASGVALALITSSFPLKLVDKSLKLRIRLLKGDLPCETGVAGDAGGRKRSEAPVDQKVCAKKQKKEDDMAARAAASATIVVDLSYDELMNEKESASLATQVKHSPTRLCSYRRHQHQHPPPPATAPTPPSTCYRSPAHTLSTNAAARLFESPSPPLLTAKRWSVFETHQVT